MLDIELTEKNIFAAYEEAVLEYSYILNIHQAKNKAKTLMRDNREKFTHKKMTELLNKIVDKYSKNIPTQVGLNLPKLKKIKNNKSQIKLPKLKKVTNSEGASV